MRRAGSRCYQSTKGGVCKNIQRAGETRYSYICHTHTHTLPQSTHTSGFCQYDIQHLHLNMQHVCFNIHVLFSKLRSASLNRIWSLKDLVIVLFACVYISMTQCVEVTFRLCAVILCQRCEPHDLSIYRSVD